MSNTKCDYCEYSKPKRGSMKCGWNIFSPEFRENACKRALAKMEEDKENK